MATPYILPTFDADVAELDPLVAIEANYPRDEIMEQRVNIEEVKEDDNKSGRSKVSRALLSLEKEVHRSGRSMCRTTTYNRTTGKAAEISAAQNYSACLAELDNEDLNNTIEVENHYVSVGAGSGDGFTNATGLEVTKYQEAVNVPD